MVKETEFYDLLCVRIDADESEIKRSYRRLALKYHPDKNPGDEQAAEMFKKISHAYETLSDSEKRRVYDVHGSEGLRGGEGGGGNGFMDAEDVFSMFFGGARRARGERKPKDLVHELAVSLAELYCGRRRKVQVSRNRLCGACGGEGLRAGAARQPCRSCQGHGVVVSQQQLFPGFVQAIQMTCGACQGAGEVTRPGDLCPHCQGKRVVEEKKLLELHIEKGTRRGEVFRFVGEGDQIPGVRLAGDVLIFIGMPKPDEQFRRIGDHLLLRRTITLREALTGFDLPIVHLDGRTIVVKVPRGQVVNPTSVWKVSQEGMPLPNTGGLQKGDLLILFAIQWPESLQPDQIDAIAKAFKIPKGIPRLGGQQVSLISMNRQRNSKNRRVGGDGGAARRSAMGNNTGERADGAWVHMASEASLGYNKNDTHARTKGGGRSDVNRRRDDRNAEMYGMDNDLYGHPQGAGMANTVQCGHQ